MSLLVIVRETSLLNLCSRFGYNTRINSSFAKVKRKYEQIKIIEENAQNNQEDLAKVFDTNRVQISRYETGKRKLDEIYRQNTPRGFRAACLLIQE